MGIRDLEVEPLARGAAPFGMNRDYYDLSHCGPADRALPVMVRTTHNIGEQTQETAGQMVAMRVAVELGKDDT